MKRCGCCMDSAQTTPVTIDNRPALSSVRYRMGDFTSFRRTMLHAIADQPELKAWTSRDETDYGIALIDMWAYLGDVLTFYQERIANEAFLGTAVHRESVARLAALLDYRPSPGAAAVAHVAFFLDRGKTLQLPAALRLQSVPGQNEKPQKFETVEAIAADAALNELRVHGVPVAFNPFAKGSSGGPLARPSPEARPGAALTVFDHNVLEAKTVAAVNGELSWTPAIARDALTPLMARAVLTARRFALYGSDVPARTMVHTLTDGDLVGIDWTERETNFAVNDPSVLPLDRTVADVKAGARVLVTGSEGVRLTTVVAADTKPQTMKPKGSAQPLMAFGANVTELKLGLAVVSRPAVGVSGNALDVYVVADDGAIWTRRRQNGWSDWRSLGGTSFTHVAAAGSAMVARGADGVLHAFSATGWTELGSGFELMAMHLSQTRPFLVARGADRLLSLRRQTQNGEWLPWKPLGGPACDLVAVTAGANGRIEVFARRLGNRDVWTLRETAPDVWNAWLNLGGEVEDGTLAAAFNQNGTVELLARGLDSAVWRRRRNGNDWSSWTSIGGWVDRIDAGLDTQGRLCVFGRGNDRKLLTSRQTAANSNSYTNWTPAGDDLLDDLTVAPLFENALHVFAGTEAILRLRKNADWSTLGVPMWPIADRRTISVTEVVGDPLPLATLRHPDVIEGGPVAIALSELASIDKGRTIVLDDATHNAHLATVASTSIANDHLLVSFTPGLTRPLDGRSALLLGNVARVTHGETIAAEVVGSGDASARFQTFTLKKSPVTHVPQAGARNGVASTLELRVDRVRWNEADSLLGRGPSERVFTTSVDEDQAMTIQFGGEPGSRLPTGRNNITARYRTGLGPEGNVRAGAIANLLDRPPGLKAARNPVRAEGGAAPETLDLIRMNAPNTVRTFGRIVSLRDFEDAAREHATVAKARATWTVDDYERVVRLTVAAEGGAVLSEIALAAIAADLDAKRDANKPMRIRSHENVRMLVTAVLQADPAHLLEDVQERAAEALAAFFSFDRLDLGQTIHLSDVYAALQGVTGVIAARLDRLRRADGVVEVADHIRIYPHEIATLAPADSSVTPQFEELG
ncbi:MAG TPA: baseplate J/gp47 family protein [Thermoanaerobaculia bacterium]|jgi:hypothetical protein